MLNELNTSRRVVGTKQLRKSLVRGEIRLAFLADDADPALTDPLEDLARASGTPVVRVQTMRELGRACGIAVGASAAGVLKNS